MNSRVVRESRYTTIHFEPGMSRVMKNQTPEVLPVPASSPWPKQAVKCYLQLHASNVNQCLDNAYSMQFAQNLVRVGRFPSLHESSPTNRMLPSSRLAMFNLKALFDWDVPGAVWNCRKGLQTNEKYFSFFKYFNKHCVSGS